MGLSTQRLPEVPEPALDAAFHLAVLDTLSEPISVVDLRGRTVFVNLAWRRFEQENGGLAAAANPIALSDLALRIRGDPHVASADDAGISRLIAQGVHKVLQGKRPRFEIDFPCHAPSQQRWFRVSARRMEGAEGFAVLSCQNVTDKALAQRELELSHQQLQTSMDRALELVQRAEQANVAKSRFLSTMSHEIRTPMNAILGMLRLIEKTALTLQQRDYTLKAVGAANALLGLVNDILDFSKIEAGMMTLDCQPLRLEQLMEELSVILSASVGNKKIELLFDCGADLPQLLVGDALRLKQVLTNLGSNAVKFTHRGEVVIGVRMTRCDAQSATLEFSVRDTGIGIAASDLTHIFSAFSQAEASTTRRFGGTGLGLAISHELVGLMGGDLQVASSVGVGSSFRFSLTLERVPDSALQGAKSPRPLPSDLGFLVVDDSVIACDLMATMLSAGGRTVDTAYSGSEALHKIQSRVAGGLPPFGAVVLDWQMPGLDGWETARQIRALHFESGAALPLLIMISANGRQLLSQRTHDEQAMLDGFLAKPVSAGMLLEAVAGALAGDRNTEAALRQSGGQRRLEGMRLLVVEDNGLNQQVAEELLSAEGALVSLAANGQLGVDAIAAARPQFDAVLMDLQMPVLDGLGAIHIIRQQLRLAQLPVIALSANAMRQDREASIAAGMTDHVGKPFEIARLVETLVRHTHWHAGQPAVSLQPDSATTIQPAAPAGRYSDTIDVAGALAWMGDDMRIYRKFLDSFMADVADNADGLQEHLNRAEQTGAARILHTLKGLARTVGALALSHFAADAETRLRAGLTPEESRQLVVQTRLAIEATTQELRAVCRAIDAQGLHTGSLQRQFDNRERA
jgi:signal transduction histidine kinase/CheY-like chemotaxis protein